MECDKQIQYLSIARDKADSMGIRCLSTKYPEFDDNSLCWDCDCGHEWREPLSVVKARGGCPECAI